MLRRSSRFAQTTTNRKTSLARRLRVEPLEDRRMLAGTPLDIDFATAFNIDGIFNRSGGVNDAANDAIDLDFNENALITETAALAFDAINGNGLPDSGSFAASGFHPAVQLGYNNDDDGLNTLFLPNQNDSATINVPEGKLESLHIFALATNGATNMEVRLNYADFSSTTLNTSVPDWFNNITEGSANIDATNYFLIDGMDRFRLNTNTLENANAPAVFGLEFPVNSSKVLASVMLTNTVANPTGRQVVVLGAMGEYLEFVVDSTDDADDGDYSDGNFTLREAINLSNASTTVDDTISFDLPDNSTITLTSQLSVTQSVTIQGPGADLLTISGGDQTRIFEFGGGGANTYVVDSLDLANARLDGDFGGAIDLRDGDDTLEIHHTTIRDSSALRGAAITLFEATAIISDSAIINNQSDAQGALFIQNANLQLENVTLSGNQSGSDSTTVYVLAAGTNNTSEVTIVNSTIVNNSGTGSAVQTQTQSGGTSATATYRNSIFAGNTGSGNLGGNSVLISLGNNISDDATGNLIAAGDMPNTDPQLGPLQDNGGPTFTHLPLPTSPAIDAISTELLTPTSVSVNAGVVNFFPEGTLIDNSGLSAVADIDNYTTVTHGVAGAGTAWVTNDPGGFPSNYFDTGTVPELTFSLGSLQSLSDIVLWGYHFGAPNNNEAKDITVSFSNDGGGSYFDSVNLTHARTAANQETISFGDTFTADTVKVTITSNYFSEPGAIGGDRVGLGEVKFIGGIPETDQRGVTRSQDGNNDGITRMDIGAVERVQTLIVNNTGDADDGDATNGQMTLREAINLSNANTQPNIEEITFDLPDNSIITLTSTQLNISDSVNIIGPGADLLTIDASGADPTPNVNVGDGIRIFDIFKSGSTIYVALSGLTLTGGDINADGGAIHNNGENVTISGSTIRNNTAGIRGGGVYNSGGTMTISGSTISDNSAGFGGGVYNSSSTMDLSGSTISNNSADFGGGAYNISGTLTISDSTISDNSASSFGGGVDNNGGIVTISGSTISDNSAAFRGGGVFSSTGVITTIFNSTISGNTATNAGGGVFNSFGLTEIQSSTITNNTAPDDEGSGIASNGFLGIRTEISSSIVAGNTNSDLNLFAAATNSIFSLGNNLLGNDPTSFTLASDIVGVDPQLGPLQDNGGPTFTHLPMPTSPAIDAINTELLTPASVSINAGVVNFFPVGTLIDNSGLSGPADIDTYTTVTHASAGSGTTAWVTNDPGGFSSNYFDTGVVPELTFSLGSLRSLSDIVIWGYHFGVGINNNEAKDITVEFSNNGGSSYFDSVNLTHAQTVDMQETLSFGNTFIADTVKVTITSNYIGTPGNVGGDRVGLGEVKFIGGLPEETDQRGVARSQDGNNDGIKRMDIGAVERVQTLIVNNTGDADDGLPNNGQMTLREAINLANSNTLLDIEEITFDLPANSIITLTSTQLNITDSVNIIGPGADLLTIDASGADLTPEQNNGDGIRIFNVSGSGVLDVEISGLTLTGGDINSNGGAIRNSSENVTISGSTISNNSARRGGGVFNSDGTMTISGSTISNNSAEFSGGGVYSDTSSSFSVPTTIVNSTISGNTAALFGGGVYNFNGLTVIRSSTITNNTAPDGEGSGISSFGNPATRTDISGSIVAGNTNSDLNLSSQSTNSIFSLGNNLLGNDPTTFALASDIVGVDPQLGPLQDNGGPTLTHLPLPTSPAIDAISAQLITPTNVSVNTAANDFYPVAQLIDNSGLSAPADIDSYTTVTHASASFGDTAWVTNAPGGFPSDYFITGIDPELTFSLGSLQSLSDIVLWGYHFGAPNNNEAKDITVEFSNDGGGSYFDSVNLTHDRTVQNQETLSFGDTFIADTVKVTITDNHFGNPGNDGGDRVGLGEVKFIGGLPQNDQRGVARSQDGNNDGITRMDIGAVERVQTLIVNNASDADDGLPNNGQMTLREAINLSNANTQPNIDEITFDLPDNSIITLTSTQLNISDSVNIIGPGADQLTIDASGADNTPEQNNGDGIRIFDISGSGVLDVEISGLTLSGGDINDDGSAIRNSGENVTISGSTISNNSAIFGGGVYNDVGTMTISDSTISNNSAAFNGGSGGGGVYNSGGTMTISNSTISNNLAAFNGGGGGVYNSGGTLTISRSTISNNSAGNRGGGVYSSTSGSFNQPTTIVNSTISGNTATNVGGGVYNSFGLTVIRSSTITDNTAPDNSGSGLSSFGDTLTRTEISSSIIAGNTNSDLNLFSGTINSIFSLGNNLLGNDPTSFTLASDIVGVDPQLGPLQDNGGPTETHALSLSSPAVDAITPQNIANTGTASQSSTLNGNQFPANLAIDGNPNTFTHTESDDVDPWWELDLGTSQVIDTIVLYNRVQCCGSRLRDITVEIRDAADNVLFTSPLLNPENVLGGGILNVGPAMLTVDVVSLAGSAVEGQKIRVIRTSDPDLSGSGGIGNSADEPDVLSLGEVEVISDTGTDQRGEQRLQRSGIDIGSFELGYLLGDLNLDDSVDSADLAILLSNYGTASGALPLEGDLDNDGLIGLKDLLLMKKNFGSTISAPTPAPQAAAAASLSVQISPATVITNNETSNSRAIDQVISNLDQPTRRATVIRSASQQPTRRSINNEAIQTISNDSNIIKAHTRRALSSRSSRGHNYRQAADTAIGSISGENL